MMEIYIVAGKGFGKTTLSAFDAALKSAGVYNFNLIYLSSIIPPAAVVKKIGEYKTPEGAFGDRLYVVKSEIRSDESGKAIAAGLGWYQTVDGRGVIVEHETKAETRENAEEEVELKIIKSLQDLCRARDFKFAQGKMKILIESAKITSQPACVLVVAVYQGEKWK